IGRSPSRCARGVSGFRETSSPWRTCTLAAAGTRVLPWINCTGYALSQPGIPDSARRIDQFPSGEANGPRARADALVGGAAVQVRAEDQRGFAGIFLGE